MVQNIAGHILAGISQYGNDSKALLLPSEILDVSVSSYLAF